MSKLSIEARVTAGTNVEKAIMDAIALSSRLGVYIDIRFNGVRLSLCRSDQLPIKLEEYHRELAVLARANELLPGETPADISKLPSGEFQPVLTLEEGEKAEAQKDREFKMRMAHEDREWQVRLIEIKDNREIQLAKLAQDERRNDMIAGFPAMIGGVLSKGSKAAAGAVQQQPLKVQLPEGETAEFDCPSPDCRAKVGIEATTEIAQCVKCGRQFPVERVAVPGSEEHKEPVPPGHEEATVV